MGFSHVFVDRPIFASVFYVVCRWIGGRLGRRTDKTPVSAETAST